MNWKTINCRECKGNCNKKGYPSVMKGNAYCESERGTLSEGQIAFWSRIRETIPLRWIRRSNR